MVKIRARNRLPPANDKTMENADKFNQIKGVDLMANPLKGIDPEILHPGAKRYYEEKGIL